MAAPGYDDQLSVSSKKALYWAAVMAALQAERSSGSASEGINVFDLFVGILLSHAKDSEAKILLDHFGLQPGQLLPEDYPLPDEENVGRTIASLPTTELPDMDSTVREVIETAMKHGMSSSSAQVVELRAVYAAILEVTSPLSDRINELISTRGASLSEIVRLNQEYMASEKPDNYAELLKQRYPYQPEPVRIPDYMTDHGQTMDLSQDLVDIRAEVDAFAYLLASRGLKPPLAVGLFGDWGSGKSFFMDSVRTRIEQLVTHEDIRREKQKDVPFWKRIIQIEFNAWHYVEGELWASLVDHIFNQLRLAGDDDDDLVEQRKKYWTEKLENKMKVLADLEENKKKAEKTLQTKQKDIARIQQQKEQNLLELEQLRQKSVNDIVLEKSIDDVKQALEPLMLSVGLPSPDAVEQQLREARTELRRGRAFVHYLEGDDAWKKITILMLAILVAPLTVWGLSFLNVSSVVSAFSGVASVMVVGLGILTRVNGWVRERFNVISEAEKKVEDEIGDKRAAWQKEVDDEKEKLKTVSAKLENLLREEKKASAEILEFEAELESITTAGVLTDFVAERAGSSDYQTRLGVPALIQQDFRKLTKLISDYNDECVKGVEKRGNDVDKVEHYFNRIILYIDDLDRCPDERVVEVLQAVHLLLAFELFVVVVAVDSRWLNHALMQHYPALTSYNGERHKATSQDYLEKIFQIPFWVRPLSNEARKNIVTGLLRGNLERTATSHQGDDQEQTLTLGEDEKDILASLDARMSPPALDAATLTITQDELDFLDRLSPLMGDTPRSVKRFVNLYQLVRIINRPTASGQHDINDISDNERLAFMLAIGDGLPHLTPELLAVISKTTGPETLMNIVESISAEPFPAEHQTLSKWLSEHANFQSALAIDFQPTIETVKRFLFRVGFEALKPENG
jgi:predicted  nucleic acid-binding Zn-ribbon protein